MTEATSNALHVPTKGELSEEVEEVLLDSKSITPTSNEVFRALKKRKKEWNVSEQRVAACLEEYNLRLVASASGDIPAHSAMNDDSSKVQKVPPRRPTRSSSFRRDNSVEDEEESKEKDTEFQRAAPGKTDSFASVDIEKVVNPPGSQIKADKSTTESGEMTGNNADKNDNTNNGGDEDEADADILEEANRRSKFILKGGSHSIQKVLKGEARKKKGLSRFDRRTIKQSPAEPKSSLRAEELTSMDNSLNSNIDINDPDWEDDEEDEDADILEEANRRSNFIMKGGSHSIQKVLKGEARKKKGFSRFDRRTIKQNSSVSDQASPEETPAFSADVLSAMDSSNNNSVGADDEEDADILEEANRRSKFMMKGGSHSIQKVLKGEARKKKGFSRFDRRSIKEKSASVTKQEGRDESDRERNAPAKPDADEPESLGGSYSENLEGDDADILEEVNKRSKFMMKGGSHSIQKVLKRDARKKKGLSCFDRRSIKQSANQDRQDVSDRSEQDKPAVSSDVLEALGDSYSESIDADLDTDGEEFAAEVAKRSKFIAKGGTHSIKKVLAGEARSSGKSGPSRINRKGIAKQDSSGKGPTSDNNSSSRTPARTISVDSTDSWIEDEANRRSRFMLKGASHSIRNLLAGKTKKEKGVSRLDRRKLHFKHEADAVHYTDKPHPKPQEINETRLKVEAEAKARAAEKKASGPRRPTRKKSSDGSKDGPVRSVKRQQEEDEDAEIEKEVDRRSLMFKGGSHSIRNLFSGKAKKNSSGISRFNRRKMHFKKESEAVHYTEKPHLKPEEINARHREEAARLRAQEEAEGQGSPKVPQRKGSSAGLDNEDPLSDEDLSPGANSSDADDEDADMDTDDDILEEVNRRSNFMMKGGSYSIQKVLRGDARKKEGITRFDRRKMHFKHEAEAVHYTETPHPNPGDINAKHLAEANKAVRLSSKDKAAAKQTEAGNGSDPEEDADADILEEADRRSKFMMKGGSYSIQKVLRGEARKKEGITRFDRRKMHFKHEAEAVHYTEKPHPKPEEINAKHKAEANDTAQKMVPRRRNTSAKQADSDHSSDDEQGTDSDILEEANRRSNFMMKGGSYSIQKVLRGEARKNEGITRFDRRKMHFKHEAEAVHYTERPHLKPEEINTKHKAEANDTAPKMVPRRRNTAAESDHSSDGDEDTDADILEEANRRSKFMMKGGSYSIQKVLRGEARKKEGITRFDRRKMHFKHEAEAVHYTEKPHPNPEEINAKHLEQSHQLEKASKASSENPADTADTGDNSIEFDDDTDADIIEEADRRSKFMTKGGSYSIQKVLRGEARKKEGITRFDRRKMHFKHEAEAVHYTEKPHPNPQEINARHQAEASGAKDQMVRVPQRKSSVEMIPPGDASARDDDSEEFTAEELALLAEAEAQQAQAGGRRSSLQKGASRSIRNIFSGKAKKQDKAPTTGMQRRTSQLKSVPSKSTGGPSCELSVADNAPAKDEDDRSVKSDRRKRFTLKGASNSIKKVMKRAAGKKNPSPMDLEIARLQDENQASDPDLDLDDEDKEIEEEANRRSNFMAKGASHSITKVLSGNARKKKEGITRFDRRKMSFNQVPGAASSAGARNVVASEGSNESSQQKRYDKDSDQPASTSSNVGKATAPEPADNDSLDDEDADLIEEADRRSKFMSKGGSYSIQKVLRGEARKKEGITRFDRRKMHFKKESQAIHSHDHDKDGDTSENPPPPPAAPAHKERSAPPAVTNAKMPSRRISQGDSGFSDSDSDMDEEDRKLLTEADERTQLMMKGGSHSLRNLFSGKAKKVVEPAGMKRRVSQLKKPPQRPSLVTEKTVPAEKTDSTLETTVSLASSKSAGPLAVEEGETCLTVKTSESNDEKEPSTSQPKKEETEPKDEDADEEADDAEDEDDGDDRRRRFTLKGASHSIKKVLAGKARGGKKETGVTRLDRRRIHLKSKSSPNPKSP